MPKRFTPTPLAVVSDNWLFSSDILSTQRIQEILSRWRCFAKQHAILTRERALHSLNIFALIQNKVRTMFYFSDVSAQKNALASDRAGDVHRHLLQQRLRQESCPHQHVPGWPLSCLQQLH